MSDLTERAVDVARGRLRSEYGGSAVEVTIAALDAAGMLTDPDAEDPRITAVRVLVQAWTDKSNRGPARTSRESLALARCAAALRRVLDGDTPGGAS